MAEPAALLVLGPSAGGIRRHVATLRDGLRSRGWRVAVAGPAGVLDGLGGTDHTVELRRSVSGTLQDAAALRRLAADVDVVHAHGMKAGLSVALSGARPRILTIHNVVLDQANGPVAAVLRAGERRVPGRMDRTIAVSQEIADRFRDAAGAERMTVIAPAGPVPVPRRDRETVRRDLGVGDGPLVVTVARLHPQKDLPTLLAAARLVLDDRPDVRFAIVGGGASEVDLRTEHTRLGLGDSVQILGQLPSAADELAAADVFALSSVWEGSPLAVAEAMLLARPVVATAVGAIPDVVEDGVTGRLVPPRAPGALASAIIELLDDPQTARRLADAGHAIAVERFSPETLVAAVEEQYRMVTR